MSIKPATIEKYMNVMVYASTLPTFSTRDITRRFHVNAGLPSRMVELGYAINLDHGQKKWVGETPNRGMAVNVARAWRKKPKAKKQLQAQAVSITEEQAIAVLKSSTEWIYTITRTKTETL